MYVHADVLPAAGRPGLVDAIRLAASNRDDNRYADNLTSYGTVLIGTARQDCELLLTFLQSSSCRSDGKRPKDLWSDEKKNLQIYFFKEILVFLILKQTLQNKQLASLKKLDHLSYINFCFEHTLKSKIQDYFL